MAKPNLEKVDPQLINAFQKAKEIWSEKYPERKDPKITYGFRTTEEQRSIRRRFGYPDDEKPSGWNNLPPASRPGRSKHEKGLAIDLIGRDWEFDDYQEFYKIMQGIEPKIYWRGDKNGDLCHYELR